MTHLELIHFYYLLPPQPQTPPALPITAIITEGTHPRCTRPQGASGPQKVEATSIIQGTAYGMLNPDVDVNVGKGIEICTYCKLMQIIIPYMYSILATSFTSPGENF